MIHDAVEKVLRECLAVKNSETVLVLTDTEDDEVARAFHRQASRMAGETLLLRYRRRERSGEEPPPIVSRAMQEADVILITASRSLSHTRARMEATRAGARIASMPRITREMAARALNVDYEALAKLTRKYAGILSSGKRARLTSANGTCATFNINGRQGLADAGYMRLPGYWGNLPAGEAAVAPVETCTSGTIVLDGSLSGWGRLETPVTLRIKEGRATEILGGEEALWLRRTLDACGPEARYIAELGMGTNEKARVNGNVLEDEKCVGTVHVALGNSKSLGGQIEAGIHLDGVLMGPTLEIDGRVILSGGRLA